MSKGWREFWRSTFSYFTLDGYTDACSRITPQWLDSLFEIIARCLVALFALFFVILLFPFVMARLIWLTPKRYKVTVKANKDQNND